MANTTASKVKAIARHLNDLDDSTIEMYIEDAQNELKETALEDNEKAQRYLAAHFGTIDIRRTKNEKIESLNKSYSSLEDKEGLKNTKYGQEVIRLANKHYCPISILKN